MKYKNEKLANLPWISRLWSQYNILPEAMKEGFSSLVLYISKAIEEEGKEKIGDAKEKMSSIR